MSTLPDGWSKATIGDLIASDGLFSDGDWVESKDQDPRGSNRLLQLADIGDGVFLNKSRRFVNDEKFVALNCTELQANDVLVARMPDPLGRACLMPELPQRCLTVVDVAILRPGANSVKPDWLMHFINSPFVRDAIELLSSGTTRRRISRRNLARIDLPVPPLDEQKRMTDKLDGLMARVEACRERLERVPHILKRFRHSVLGEVTSGQLTEDWRNERHNIREWQVTLVQSIATVGTGSTPLRSNPRFYSNTGTPWITSAATSEPFVTRAEEFVTDEAISAHRLKLYPIGTLLVAMYGEGKTRGQVSELAIEATINQACAAVIVNEAKAARGFVKLALQANYLEMRELAEGGSQPNLNLSKIKDFKLPLPSLDEQYEIIRRVEALFAYVDRLEERYKAAHARVEQLTPALLAKAFRGELVPQDPKDEPASVLLERIRGSHATVESSEEITRAKRRTHLVKKSKAQIIMLKRKDIEPSHLSTILKAKGPLTAEALWSASQLDIDDFYDQLKDEETKGLLRELVGEQRLLEAA